MAALAATSLGGWRLGTARRPAGPASARVVAVVDGDTIHVWTGGHDEAALAYLGLGAEEREVLFLRFGLADGRARSMKEIARALDITHAQARDLLGAAIEKVRTRVALEA